MRIFPIIRMHFNIEVILPNYYPLASFNCSTAKLVFSFRSLYCIMRLQLVQSLINKDLFRILIIFHPTLQSITSAKFHPPLSLLSSWRGDDFPRQLSSRKTEIIHLLQIPRVRMTRGDGPGRTSASGSWRSWRESSSLVTILTSS